MKFRNKYKAKKVYVDGIEFDSKKEAKRYSELKLMEKTGMIHDLRIQQVFELIPSQYEYISTGGYYKKGKNKGKPKTKKICVEKVCAYKADFMYECKGETVVEDTKGFRTKDYIIKRKLMLYIHGIKIREI